MKAHLQPFEIQTVGRDDDDLAVDDAAVGQLCEKRLVQFGEVSVERPQVPTLNIEVVATAKHERAKSVPLRLEDPLVTRR